MPSSVARVYEGLDVQGDQGGQFPWKSRLVDVGGARMAYVDEGPRRGKVTFLLLHGNPAWGFLYRFFVRRLAPHFRVVVPDHVGFGRSDKPREESYHALERHIRNLESLVDQLQLEKVVLVVHDWGGPIGMGWAGRHPDKVAGVVVLNTWAFVRDPPMRLPCLFKLLFLGPGGWRRIVAGNFFVERMLPRGTTRPLPKEVMDAYRAPFPVPEDRIGMAHSPRMIPETHRADHPEWITMAAVEDGLEGLSGKPALICWAMRDLAFRKPQLERWRRVFPQAQVVRLTDAKHFLQEDAAPEILNAIEGWARGL